MLNLNSKNFFWIMLEMLKNSYANANGANQTFSTLMRSETKTVVYLFIPYFNFHFCAPWLFHHSFF